MKQFHFFYEDEAAFEQDLEVFEVENQGRHIFFSFFCETMYTSDVQTARDVLERVFPEAQYIGFSTGGTIVNCKSCRVITLTALVFDDPDTKALVEENDCSGKPLKDIGGSIVDFVNENKWIKSIELFYPIPKQSTTDFCETIAGMRPDVQITGGITCSTDVSSEKCMVFTSRGRKTHSDMMIGAVFYGGENLHVLSTCVQGWKPLGRIFKVTKANGPVIFELDGIPACDVYKKYLNIEGDENFFFNTLEFPIYLKCGGVPVLRTPLSANDDGSITMGSDFEVGDEIQISYGDPVTIVNNIAQDSRSLDEFAPDVMHIFSCIARKTYWSGTDPNYEIAPLEPISQSSGFFTHGEFLRSEGTLVQHNVTLVIAALREGDKAENERRVNITDKSFSNTKMSLASRLATFIGVTSEQLLMSNRELAKTAITDGLTQLYNRKEIQSQINAELQSRQPFSLVMLDIDNFKSVNDTYGHKSGDDVIITVSEILRQTVEEYGEKAAAGRWGGEEFMLLLRGVSISDASKTAEKIRTSFAAREYEGVPSQTASFGVTEYIQGENLDTVCSRVDAALYQAKDEGKNRVVIN